MNTLDINKNYLMVFVCSVIPRTYYFPTRRHSHLPNNQYLGLFENYLEKNKAEVQANYDKLTLDTRETDLSSY